MTPIVEAYFKLTKLMEDIDYYNKYPSRMYIREFIEREDTIEGKVRAMLRDSIIQREAIPNWMSLWRSFAEAKPGVQTTTRAKEKLPDQKI